MVVGLDKFKEHFKSFEDEYILIGGSACSVWMQEASIDYRSTKDLDLIICAKADNKKFYNSFFNFIEKAGYSNKQYSSGRPKFYRFLEPTDKSYPFMLELSGKVPDDLQIPDYVKYIKIKKQRMATFNSCYAQ